MEETDADRERGGYFLLYRRTRYIPANNYTGHAGAEQEARKRNGREAVLVVRAEPETREQAKARFAAMFPDDPELAAGLLWRWLSVRGSTNDLRGESPQTVIPPDMRR